MILLGTGSKCAHLNAGHMLSQTGAVYPAPSPQSAMFLGCYSGQRRESSYPLQTVTAKQPQVPLTPGFSTESSKGGNGLHFV